MEGHGGAGPRDEARGAIEGHVADLPARGRLLRGVHLLGGRGGVGGRGQRADVWRGAEEAPGYKLLSESIKAGVRLAIKLSERI